MQARVDLLVPVRPGGRGDPHLSRVWRPAAARVRVRARPARRRAPDHSRGGDRAAARQPVRARPGALSAAGRSRRASWVPWSTCSAGPRRRASIRAAGRLRRARLRGAGDDPAGHDAAAASTEQARAYGTYQALLGRHGLIDHGDQLASPARLLRETADQCANEVVDRYRYLLVDELQDMNRAQLELCSRSRRTGRNVTVVGDPDQAIYTFRGAAATTSAVRRAHPDLRRVVLRRNYRSRQPIVDAATRLIGHGPRPHVTGLDATPSRGPPRSPPDARAARRRIATPEAEADGVAAAVAARIAAGAGAARLRGPGTQQCRDRAAGALAQHARRARADAHCRPTSSLSPRSGRWSPSCAASRTRPTHRAVRARHGGRTSWAASA